MYRNLLANIVGIICAIILVLVLIVGITFSTKEPESESGITFIDFSNLVSQNIDSDTVQFSIPTEFSPNYKNGSLFFTFWLELSKQLPSLSTIENIPPQALRIIVRTSDKENSLRSVYKLSNLENSKYLDSNLGYFSGYSDSFKTYSYSLAPHSDSLGTYYLKTDDRGNQIVIDDPGNWSRSYRVYRRLNSNVEIDYNLTKNIPLKDWSFLDKYILETIASFQRPYD